MGGYDRGMQPIKYAIGWCMVAVIVIGFAAPLLLNGEGVHGAIADDFVRREFLCWFIAAAFGAWIGWRRRGSKIRLD